MLHFTGEQGFDLVEKGEYEVTLTAEWKVTKQTNQKYINCIYTIRKDIDQKFQGRMIFDGIYKSQFTGDFDTKRINGILSTIPNARLDFEDYDELIQYINGINMVVTVDVKPADPSNPESKAKNIIVLGSYKPTGNKHVLTEVDELPF